jgi:hypothetical protein
MTFIEILIIYLAIGAPFGVYYFLKHRELFSRPQLLAKTLLAALFWVYYAGQLVSAKLRSLKDTQNGADSDVSREKEIEAASQSLLNAFSKLADDGKPTFFEYREILERYIGLTLAVQNSSADSPVQAHETEVFRVVGHEKSELQLAGRIMHRKNFLRLQAHERAARHDFLQVAAQIYEKKSFPSINLNGKLEAWHSYQRSILLLAELLEDAEAAKALKRLADSAKTVEEKNGKREKAIWKTLQPSPAINPLHPSAASAQAMPTTNRRD